MRQDLKEKNDVQKEFDRFKMDYVQVAPKKLVGDPKGNREARQFVATMVESGLSQLINSPEYINEPSDLIKKKMLTTRILCNRKVVKILHGSDSLDIPFVYNELLENNVNMIKDFNLSFIDTEFLCEYSYYSKNWNYYSK